MVCLSLLLHFIKLSSQRSVRKYRGVITHRVFACLSPVAKDLNLEGTENVLVLTKTELAAIATNTLAGPLDFLAADS